MELTFHSIEEVQEFVKRLKGTRGAKGEKDDEAPMTGQAPAPLAPPAGGAPAQGFGGAAGFAPPAAGATQGAGGPFAPAAPAVAPEVQQLVQRIDTRIKAARTENPGLVGPEAIAWFRNQFQTAGIDASNAALEQMAEGPSPLTLKLSVAQLTQIAKVMNA